MADADTVSLLMFQNHSLCTAVQQIDIAKQNYECYPCSRFPTTVEHPVELDEFT